MDLSAGGLAPTPRDGTSSQASVVDPLDAFLSPLGSPGLPTDAASQAALKALSGESETEPSRPLLTGARGHDAADSAGGHIGPSRAFAKGSQDLKIKGSAGSAGKDRQEPSSAFRPRLSVVNTCVLKSYSSRYFGAPGVHGKGSASRDEHAAGDDFHAGHVLTGFEGDDEVHAQPSSVTNASKHVKDSPATQNGAPGSIAPSKSQQGATSGPSQVGGADGDNLSVASGGGRRYTLTAFRHLARLDKFASEEGRNSPAPEQSEADDDERMDLESEFSVGTGGGGGGGARSGYDPTEDGMSVRSGYKRAASEMDRGEYEEEEEFGRYRRSDTPFNESEYPGDDAASSVRSIAPSRTYGRSRRSRSVAFSERSLHSERSQDDGDEESSAPSGMQDSGFYAVGEGEKPIVTEAEDENGDVDVEEGLLYGDNEAAAASHAENNNEPQYFDFDPLMPMESIYVGTKHPHLAYAAALAQAVKDAENAEAREVEQQQQQQQEEEEEDQENVAPSESEARAQGQKKTTTEPKETSESVIEKWNAARADTVERFGSLMSRVDQLLEGKIQRHEKLDSTLSAHQSTLNERFKQLRQTKAGLRQWGNQLFASLKTAEQESGAAAGATAAAAAAAAKEGETAVPAERTEAAGGQQGGKATATDPTFNGGATAAAAPVTSVDES